MDQPQSFFLALFAFCLITLSGGEAITAASASPLYLLVNPTSSSSGLTHVFLWMQLMQFPLES